MTRLIDGKVYISLEYWLNSVEYVDINCSREEIKYFWETFLSPVRYKIISTGASVLGINRYYQICSHLYILLDDKNSTRGEVTLHYIRNSVVHKVADLKSGHDPVKVAEDAVMAGLADMAMEIA